MVRTSACAGETAIIVVFRCTVTSRGYGNRRMYEELAGFDLIFTTLEKRVEPREEENQP
jgi:hypothetical protein